MIDFLERARPRIGAVHFKDFATMAPVVDTVPLGRGVVPLVEAAVWLKDNIGSLWVIAEQDNTDGDPADAVAENGAFLNRHFPDPLGTEGKP